MSGKGRSGAQISRDSRSPIGECFRQTAARQSSAATICAILAGCATYTPAPLDESAIDGALAVPDEAALNVRASELDRPAWSSIRIRLADGVSPDEAAVLSVLLNPALRALRASRGIAKAETFSAGLLPDPTLTVSADVPVAGATAGTFIGYGLGIDWPVSSLIDLEARTASARLNEQAVQLDVLWSESLVATRARALVYSAAAAERSLALLDEEIDLLTTNLQQVSDAVRAGQLTEVDQSAAQASLDTARTQRTAIQEQRDRAQIELATTLGFPPDAPLKVAPPSDADLMTPAPALSELLARIERRRFDLLALRIGYESQEERVRAAILRQFPRLSLGPTFLRDTGDVITAGFGLALDLPILNRNQGVIAIERATREQLRQEYASRVHDARAALALELNALTSAQARLASLQQTEQSRASLVETYRVALEQGQVDVLSYYQARRDLIEARIQIAQTTAQILGSRILVETLSGHLAPAGSAAGAQPNQEPAS